MFTGADADFRPDVMREQRAAALGASAGCFVSAMPKPGQLTLLHCAAVDSRRRLLSISQTSANHVPPVAASLSGDLPWRCSRTRLVLVCGARGSAALSHSTYPKAAR